ncbi:MAG TPA: DUF4440 domain-containing protein [Gammaproteobacteria bacterium]|nr:DUF4440 domain-containing protein [Gammaproteobacteria bacterium]
MASELAPVIRRLEEQLLDPAFRRSATAVAALLADEFQEVGSSGRRYDKSQILAALAQEDGFTADVTRFAIQALAPDHVLATYCVSIGRAGSAPQHSLRSSLWRKQDGNWQLLFHQGTPVA